MEKLLDSEKTKVLISSVVLYPFNDSFCKVQFSSVSDFFDVEFDNAKLYSRNYSSVLDCLFSLHPNLGSEYSQVSRNPLC